MLITCLRLDGYTVHYEENIDEEWKSEPLINGRKLFDVVEEIGMHNLLKKHVVAITRIFDHRVQCFMNDIVMNSSASGMNVTYYNYRIEFQKRGIINNHYLEN